jgi:hypothetical protein
LGVYPVVSLRSTTGYESLIPPGSGFLTQSREDAEFFLIGIAIGIGIELLIISGVW